MSQDERRLWVLCLVLTAWVLAFGWSVIGAAGLEPQGDGFTRGLNRVRHFLGWQGVALCVAWAAFALGRGWPRRTGLRRVAALPLWIEAILFVAIVGAYGTAALMAGG